MLPKYIVSSLLLLLVDGTERLKLLPDFVIPCADDPHLLKCPAQLLYDLRHRLVQGIPEFQLPPIDPLILPQVIVTRRGSAILDFTTNVTDIVWRGTGGFEILETFVDQEALVFRLKLKFPYLHANADAFAVGRVLSFSVRGGGDFSCNSTNVVLDIVLNGERYERDGLKFIAWRKENIGIDYDSFYYTHVNGFFDDPSVAHLFMAALNRAIRLIGRSTKAFIVDSVGDFVIESINRVHSLYPIDVLYPRSL